MELYAENRIFPVHDSHHGFVGCRRGYEKAIRCRSRIGRERMVAGDTDRVGQPLEERTEHLTRRRFNKLHGPFLAVNQFGRVDDRSTKCFEDRLVPQTDAEDRDLLRERFDRANGDARRCGKTGTGRHDDMRRMKFRDFALRLMEKGVYMNPSATLHSLSSIVHTEADIAATASAMAEVLEEMP